MDAERFIAERRARWDRLESLLDAAEASRGRGIGPGRLAEIVRLYRQTCSDLNEARSFTASPEVLDRLDLLAGRGYRFVYTGGGRAGPRWSARRFFLAELPATFRREGAYVACAAASLVLGAVLGFAAVLADPRWAEELIPAPFFTESPRDRVEKIESGEERIGTAEEALAFGTSLYTHNIQVSFLAFSLGALTLAGGAAILFYNGVLLGAVAAAYVLEGVHVFFLAWVGPHGALEIPAIVFGGAAGLRAGRALLLPGDMTTGDSLRAAFPAVFRILIATALILVLAGLIEGSFSQFTARTVPYGLKILVSALLFAGLTAYLFGRSPQRGGGGR